MMKFINTVNRYLMKNNSLTKYIFSALCIALLAPVPVLAKNIIAAPHYSVSALQHQSMTKKPAGNYATPAKPLVLNMSKASEVKVYLKSNATTGYSWFLKDGPYTSFLKPVSHHYVAPKTNLVGAPGYEVWTFGVSTSYLSIPIMTKLNFSYARPWELKSIKDIAITVFIVPR